ncbi:hypothetical protein AKJ09_08780 [Labilithrix luteola]|uniref:Uncharacterized protein n=1 Tax=Labilithrix luteola TaxID=1391654 RepID=A0A0K1Q8W2_9BACT|nr:hypothetical protein [Labilithrix luteola]AKV02117.1 hypothetical protein AKJ09_08780 [Labilithrix luteola]
MGSALVGWLGAFAFTQAVEVPIYARALRCGWARAAGASALTHPIVWFVFPAVAELLSLEWLTMVIIAELFAWWAEAAYFRKVARVPWPRALAVSLAANGASVLLGLLSRACFDWP